MEWSRQPVMCGMWGHGPAGTDETTNAESTPGLSAFSLRGKRGEGFDKHPSSKEREGDGGREGLDKRRTPWI